MQPLTWYFTVGGPLMWPLLACAVLALGVIFERFIRLRRSALIDPGTVDAIRKLVEAGEAKLAVERYGNSSAAIGKAICKGLDDHEHHDTPIERALSEAGELELHQAADHLSILSTIVKIAPLIGLLGTVAGMIDAFEALQRAAAGKDKLVSSIRVALVTTATGLLIAIPCQIALAYFRARIRRFHQDFTEVFHVIARSLRHGPRRMEKKPEARVEEESLPTNEDRFELPSILTGNAGS